MTAAARSGAMSASPGSRCATFPMPGSPPISTATGRGLPTPSASYKLEEEGVRLFARIEGDHFTILGLPMLELLSYLTVRGVIPG